MTRNIIFYTMLFFHIITSTAQEKQVNLKFVETSDIHGNFFPYDFIQGKRRNGSLSRVHTYIQEQRKTWNDNLILIDNGDILQGQPSSYFYNYIDTVSPHLCAQIMNYMGYNIGNVGNHDIEISKERLDRCVSQCNFPILGANVLDVTSGKPYFTPYKVIEKEGVKVVVLGLVTSAIPIWLPEDLWKGLYFEDMEESARKWMKIIRKKEKPDLVIGLFHSGQTEVLIGNKYWENTSLRIARKIPGFDVIMIGHDHIEDCKTIINEAGKPVLVMNPASDGALVAEVDVKFHLRKGKVVRREIAGSLVSMDKYKPCQEFMDRFSSHYDDIDDFVSTQLGVLDRTVTSSSAFFGPSPFVDMIHSLQLDITKADVSFTAPFVYDSEVRRGEIKVGDLFVLYKYENFLYTMRMTGSEIKNYLEESYSMWTNRMKSPDDNLLNLKEEKDRCKGFDAFRYFIAHFDSAAGIVYTVDVTKRKGEKINIIEMADGSPFDLKKEYKVAINSFRGNGGGELLTKGAGIAQEELEDRITTTTDKDLRYYLIQFIKQQQVLQPQTLNHWKFIPEEWTKPAAERDYKLLFDNKEE